MKNWLEFAEPELLRFMMISYQPQTVIDFDLHTNKFFLLTDRYDCAEKAYFQENKQEKRDFQLSRQFELAQTEKIHNRLPEQISYSLAVIIVQVFPNKSIEELIPILYSRGWINKENLNDFEKDKISKRLNLTKKWLEKYAPEDLKFEVQTSVPKDIDLTEKEKEVLHKIAEILKQNELDEKTLFNEFYNISKNLGLEPKDFFKAAYKVLLNKDKGPKLAPFIFTLGRDKVSQLFGSV
jgi:lysyl-tRNA synthetase class 1